jgi:type I restriction enzyme R subunit
MDINSIGKPERVTENRIVKLFKTDLNYDYLGDWEEEVRTQPVE